jgi:hypothetical protein
MKKKRFSEGFTEAQIIAIKKSEDRGECAGSVPAAQHYSLSGNPDLPRLQWGGLSRRGLSR